MNIQRNMQNGISIMCALIILGFVACRCLLFLAYIHSNVLQAVLDTHSVHQLLDYDGKRSAQGDFVTMSWSNGEHTWACTSQWCVHWPLDILVFIPGICIASILCNQVEIAQPQLKIHTHTRRHTMRKMTQHQWSILLKWNSNIWWTEANKELSN